MAMKHIYRIKEMLIHFKTLGKNKKIQEINLDNVKN